jgi:GH15 family glucan-1,4-alpha-glucosidase
MPAKIEDYAMIGDCETAALVRRDGSIDWLCWPRFDSAACFAALLGTAENGRWLLAPSDAATSTTRRYRGDTLILETRFTTATGSVVVIDFMPPRGKASDLMRLVIGEQGTVSMRTELVLRFGYGAFVPWVTHVGPGTWRAIAGPDMVTLFTPAPLHGEDHKSVAEFTIKAGERMPFVLTYSPSHLPPPAESDIDAALADTASFWEQWIARAQPCESWPECVRRSLVTLRALIYAPTGAIVAAPTTSLPEQLGGVRNWDYRFCWLRDATLTLLALLRAGFYEESVAWRDWLLRAIAGNPEQTQTLYGVAGERYLKEWVADWLPGFQGSKPVRIGNAAHSQLQLDVYGEVIDALHQARRAGMDALDHAWSIQRELLDYLATAWEQPDESIWEVRCERRHFTYSKVMCWVAFDRSLADAEQFGFTGPIEQWRALRARIHAEVCERGYDAERNCFVQSYGSPELDASLLLIPAVGFLPPTDPRVLGTIAAIERNLMEHGLVKRYHTSTADDGLPAGEGMFLACSFWLADAYALCGRRAEARALYERLLALRNDVGLLAEEYDPVGKQMLGNFPQAFSHLSLIATAYNLSQGEHPVERRSATAS